MKNIKTINPEEMSDFFKTFWKTTEFVDLQKNHPFFKEFINKLSKSPIFFFDLTHENGRYHLTSHMRLIARRNYDDSYLHDLYYFHELLHCAEFNPAVNNNYDLWKKKLNENELYASLVSEALVYYMKPEMIGKTFDNLWVKKFYEQDVKNCYLKDNFGFFLQNEDEQCKFDVMTFNNIKEWPKSIQRIHKRRNELREIVNVDDVDDPAEKFIVKYNKPRIDWIERWKPHYEKIDAMLLALGEKKISSADYLNKMIANSDGFGRAFYPKAII